MLLEMRNQILSLLDKNLVILRDEDWEVLCLLWRDKEWYFVYYMEHCNITKSDAKALLDKASWVTSIPIVDEKIYNKNREDLENDWDKVGEILDYVNWEE